MFYKVKVPKNIFGYIEFHRESKNTLNVNSVMNYKNHPCIGMTKKEEKEDYISALYLTNGFYSAIAFMPLALI